MKWILLIVFFVIFIFTSILMTDTIVFQPGSLSEDSYIDENSPGNNYGYSSNLSVGDLWDGNIHTLIKFVELDDYYGVIVHSATLELYIHDDFGGGAGDCYIATITGDWSEDTVTWNNRPESASPRVYIGFFPGRNEWLSVDVTEILEYWLEDLNPNYGFYIYQLYFVEQGSDMYSGDYSDDETLRPKLILDYSETVMESDSLGKIKSLFQ